MNNLKTGVKVLTKIEQLEGYSKGGFIVPSISIIESFCGDDYIIYNGGLYNVRPHQITPDNLSVYGIRFKVSEYDIKSTWYFSDLLNNKESK